MLDQSITDQPKRCSACRQWLPRTMFHRNRAQPDGWANQCKPCFGLTKAKRTEQERVRRAQYYQDNKARFQAQKAEWKRKDRERRRANAAPRLPKPSRARSREEHNREQRRVYALADKEKRNAYLRRRYAEYAEEKRNRLKEWRAANPDKVALQNKRHRLTTSRIAGLKVRGRCSLEQFTARCEYYGWLCYLCGGAPKGRNFTADHRIPLARGGTNWPANLAPCCRNCNSKKQNQTEKEYRALLH